MGLPGLEPGTSALSVLRSNQLSYSPRDIHFNSHGAGNGQPSVIFCPRLQGNHEKYHRASTWLYRHRKVLARPGTRLPRVHPVWKREGRTAPAECTVLGQSRSDPTSHHADIIVRTTFTGDPTRIVLRGSLVDLWDRLPSVCSEGIKQGALPWRRAGRSEFGRRPGPGEISYWNVSDRTPQSGGKLQLDNHQLLRHACLLSIYAAAHCLLSSR